MSSSFESTTFREFAYPMGVNELILAVLHAKRHSQTQLKQTTGQRPQSTPNARLPPHHNPTNHLPTPTLTSGCSSNTSDQTTTPAASPRLTASRP